MPVFDLVAVHSNGNKLLIPTGPSVQPTGKNFFICAVTGVLGAAKLTVLWKMYSKSSLSAPEDFPTAMYFSITTGVENIDHPVPVFLLTDAHSYGLSRSTPMRWLVQPAGTKPVPGMFAGGGSGIRGCYLKDVLDIRASTRLGCQARDPRHRLISESHLLILLTKMKDSEVCLEHVVKSSILQPCNRPLLAIHAAHVNQTGGALRRRRQHGLRETTTAQPSRNHAPVQK